MVARLQRFHAGADLAHHPRALMAEDGRKDAFRIGAGQGELIGVANAGCLDLDQHLALAGALQLDRRYFKWLAGLDSQCGAHVHSLPPLDPVLVSLLLPACHAVKAKAFLNAGPLLPGMLGAGPRSAQQTFSFVPGARLALWCRGRIAEIGEGDKPHMMRTATDGDRTFEAAAMMAFAMLLLPLMDAAGKYLALYEGVTPGTTSLWRFVIQVLLTAPVILVISGLRGLRPNRWGPNLVRGLLLGWASGLFLIAVKYVPIADAMAIFFVEPFILTALSALLLREQVRWPRWLAIVVGFAGALLVIQPNFAAFGFVSLLPLGTATLFAVYLLLNRIYSAHDGPLVMQFAAGIGGTLAIAAVLPAGTLLQVEDIAWSVPGTGLAVALLVLAGLISAYGHLIVVAALRLAPASLLAPFQYFEIVMAAIVGYLVFGNFPTLSKWFGIAIIIGSGLFILWREQRRSDKRKHDFSR